MINFKPPFEAAFFMHICKTYLFLEEDDMKKFVLVLLVFVFFRQ
jgi:hypothetical protein